MKKILCIFACLLLLTSCNVKEVENEPLEISGFNTVVKAVVNDIEIQANAEYIPFNSLDFTFLKPDSVRNMQVLCKNGEYTVKTEKLTFTLVGDKMPFNMICRMLEECVNTVQGTAPQKDTNSEMLIYPYNADGHICRLYVEKETKNFVKLSVDGTDFLFFENFTFTVGHTE